MTAIVTANSNLGVILIADSAVTFTKPDGTEIIQFGHDKIFASKSHRIAIAVCGLFTYGATDIRKVIVNFIDSHVDKIRGNLDILSICRQLIEALMNEIEPDLLSKPDDGEILTQIVIGAVSDPKIGSELWEITLYSGSNSIRLVCKYKPADNGLAFYALSGPIMRYAMGFDKHVIKQIFSEVIPQEKLSDEVNLKIAELLENGKYRFSIGSRTLDEIELILSKLISIATFHYELVEQKPFVGGEATVCRISCADSVPVIKKVVV